jgi:hypothetical protein
VQELIGLHLVMTVEQRVLVAEAVAVAMVPMVLRRAVPQRCTVLAGAVVAKVAARNLLAVWGHKVL